MKPTQMRGGEDSAVHEKMRIRRAILISSSATVIIAAIVVALTSAKRPSVGLREVGRTIISAATLYSVLHSLRADQMSTNWPQMVSISGVDLVAIGDVPREYISDIQQGSNIVLTNRSGTGGWFFNVGKKTLSLNVTNPVSFKFGQKTILLPSDFLLVNHSGVRLSLGSESNAELAKYLDDRRAKADLILEAARKGITAEQHVFP